MQGLLVRIGVDHSYGAWNAPVDPQSGCFVYVPIPEGARTQFQPGMARSFSETVSALNDFATQYASETKGALLPERLLSRHMHLDPDFDCLTYGDDGRRRGAGLRGLVGGDLVVFYAGLRPTRPSEHRLLYALVGLYVVEQVALLPDIPRDRWRENAHTRRLRQSAEDIVVRGRPMVSGRLEQCIPIGEWRDGAYRVRRDVLTAWGGLSVKDGYIQRSVVPPSFLDADSFYRWFLAQNPVLIARNL